MNENQNARNHCKRIGRQTQMSGPAGLDAAPGRLIALDWGTSSLRAWLLDGEGRSLDRRQSPMGILEVQDGDFRAAFETMCSDWMAQQPALPVIASGMIGSRQGWREAPYLRTPADPADLARDLLVMDDVAGRLFRIVPGLLTEGGDGLPDVMRGEETQILGALASGLGSARGRVVVLPGTHSKWVQIGDGAIVAFRTWMTGELYSVLRQHSILGKLALPPQAWNAAVQSAFDDGVARAADAAGAFGRLLFSARSRVLVGDLAAEQVSAYLSGLLIGSEIHDAMRLFDAGVAPPLIIAEPELAARYESAFRILGHAAHTAPPDAAVRGLLAIARSAGLVDAAPIGELNIRI